MPVTRAVTPGPSRWRAAATIGALLLAIALSACGYAGDGSSAPGATAASVGEITVAAASDLQPAFEELGAAFEERTGTRVRFSFGSSGQLREQIINGAPFDLFASANVEYVDEVIDAGRGVASTKANYAYGRIVLSAPAGVELPASIAELADPRYRRIAIANPEHAPYGLAAKEALQSAGTYDDVEGRLVYGESIGDTFRITRSGNADASIVAISLAIADGSDYRLIPAELHEPLRQVLVVTTTGARGEAATAFAAFIRSPEGREVLTRYGFDLPGARSPER